MFGNLLRGVATVATAAREVGAIVNVSNNNVLGKIGAVAGAFGALRSAYDEIRPLTRSTPGKTSGKQGANVRGFPNPLEEFASYSPLWTLACLTPRQYNNPASYRKSPADLKHVVFAGAGRFDGQRVKTKSGTPEYYLDDFIMKTQISASQRTGNSNAIAFEFTIYEPYSMGLFLQSLQLAALNAGNQSYLFAPYVLRLDFMGFKDDGTLYKTLKPKFFTMKLSKVEFDTNEGGSVYKVTAIPFNHQGFSNTINKTFTDVAIQGDRRAALTVKHLLVEGNESLCAVLNRNEADAVKNKRQTYPDEYQVQFPDTPDQLFNTTASYATTLSGATVNPATGLVNAAQALRVATGGISASFGGGATNNFGSNAIGASSMGIQIDSGGNRPFARHGDIVDPRTGVISRNQMTIDPQNNKFQFPQGQSLTQIIAQVILSSKFAGDAVQSRPSPEGFIKWFKIDVQIQLKEFDTKRGDYARKVIYRVIPYNVHVSIFGNTTSAPPGYEQLEKLIAKQYSYIYSGQNNDVLSFDIKINNLFYNGTAPRPESQSGANANVDQRGVGENTPRTTATPEGPAGANAIAGNNGGPRAGPDPAAANSPGHPSGNETTESLVAKQFQEAFKNNSGDLINVDLEILGDTYWLVESGIGNYFSKPSSNPLVTLDGTMNYEGSDVYIYITFRTPSDVVEEAGIYAFPDGSKESPFSGIYKVTYCENTFAGGIFKQKLKCIRMPLQANDFDGRPQPTNNDTFGAIKIGPREAPQTSVAETFRSLPTDFWI